MSSDTRHSNDRDPTFSFATRELREARRQQALSLTEAPAKSTSMHHGVDPYNTSGSFDRTKNWARVGKR